MTLSSNSPPVKDVALVTRNPQIGIVLADILSRNGAELRLLAEGLSDNPRSALPELAILDVDLCDAAERAELERVLTVFGEQVAFVVTSRTPTVEGMRVLLRHGIVDLLPQPLVVDEVMRAVALALEGVRRRPHASAPPNKRPAGAVACVLRAGGGVGGTAIATQAACALGKTLAGDGQVCLLDLDLQFGSAAFHLGLDQRTHLLDLGAAAESLDGAMLKNVMARHPGGIDVLAAPPGIHPLDALTPELVLTLISEARRHYTVSVVDLPLPWTAGTRVALGEASRILLVALPTMPSLRHARRQIEVIHQEGLEQVPLRVVVNRYQRGLFANGLSAKDIEAALGRRVDHFIPADPRFEEAANLGKSLSDLGAAKVVKSLAALLDGLVQPAKASS